MKEVDVNAVCRLKAYRRVLTHQQYQTLLRRAELYRGGDTNARVQCRWCSSKTI